MKMLVQQRVKTAHSMIDGLNADGIDLILSILQSLDGSKWVNREAVFEKEINSVDINNRRLEAFERIEERRKKYKDIPAVDYDQAKRSAISEKYGVSLR